MTGTLGMTTMNGMGTGWRGGRLRPGVWLAVLLGAWLAGGSPRAGGAEDEGTRGLRAGDLVLVDVFQEEDLTVKVRVASDGMVRLPLVGRVRIGGLTPDRAAEAVRARFADGYLVDPQVNVTVIAYARERFTILGQVQRPGAYHLPERGELTLLEAVGLSGGFTRLANARKVVLKRRDPAGRVRIFEIDVKAIARGGGSAEIVIRPGDVITVPESLF